ncbi:MAG TPA: 16S rRNA (uracil(1498)-N(3))-methyltransferase [Pirellulaceae bacterium]|nr:16S rRNA (uracil(1498)-N(3))-methyltransferase [Pirellulaceae bacterium]
MSQRFYLETPLAGELAVITGAEAQHLSKVMRAAPGDEIVLFDGSGGEFRARIERIGRHEVEAVVVERRAINRELSREVTLAVALPKGDRQQWLVEKLTELGVTRLVPLITRRGVAQPVDNALARLRRYVIEASKQCERNTLLEIAAPENWTSYVRDVPQATGRYLAHPLPEANRAALPSAGPLVFAVGPEGGWTEEEVASAWEHGWRAFDLGPRILRVETAAIALAVLAGQSS